MTTGSGIMTNQRARLAHLVRGKGGVPGEIADLRSDIIDEFAASAAIAVEEWTNPALADTDGIMTVVQSLLSTAVTYDSTLEALAADIDPPRNVTVTTGAGGTPAHSPSEATIVGKDINGDAISEVIALSQAAATDAGALAFAVVESVTLKNDGSGTGAALEVGFGTVIGLSKPLMPRAAGSLALLEIVDGAIVGGGGGGASAVTGATVDNATADTQATAFSGVARFVNPVAKDVVAVVANTPIVDGALGFAAQPDFPRKLQVDITDGDASISAGDLTLVGVGADGAALTQVIPLTNGTEVVVTDDAYATVTSATIASVAGATGADLIGIGPDSALGLPIPAGAASVVVNKTCVDSADETVAGVDATARTVDPTTAPDAAKDYDFYYSYTLAPVQDAHTHAVTDAGHTHGAAGGTGGAFVAAATSAPNGTYEPDTAPDGAHDYALLYEYDPTA